MAKGKEQTAEVIFTMPAFSRTVSKETKTVKDDDGNEVERIVSGSGESIQFPAIPLTAEKLDARLSCSVEEAAAYLLYKEARGAVDSTADAKTARKQYAEFVFELPEQKSQKQPVSLSSLSDEVRAQLAGLSAEALAAMSVEFVD